MLSNREERKASEGLSVVDELWMKQDWRQEELFRGCQESPRTMKGRGSGTSKMQTDLRDLGGTDRTSRLIGCEAYTKESKACPGW